MILKICIACLRSASFNMLYDTENVASCPADGTCEHCRKPLHSHELRWISAMKVDNGAPAVFPPRVVTMALATERGEKVLTESKPMTFAEHVSDELTFFYGMGKHLPMPTAN